MMYKYIDLLITAEHISSNSLAVWSNSLAMPTIIVDFAINITVICSVFIKESKHKKSHDLFFLEIQGVENFAKSAGLFSTLCLL